MRKKSIKIILLSLLVLLFFGLGFAVFYQTELNKEKIGNAGSLDMNYLIMKNGNALIGLFEGMFEKNMITFNPGWDENAKLLDSFDDVRVIQRHLKNAGVKLETEADENTSGPASIILIDPDGNPVLIDQHV